MTSLAVLKIKQSLVVEFSSLGLEVQGLGLNLEVSGVDNETVWRMEYGTADGLCLALEK